jgi:DNA/RNA-binding domain of Phe-tRNA-synthetase-like protein
LRRLDKQGEIPSISTLVHIGNLVSIRYAIPVAIFDLAEIKGALVVRFVTGDEWFTDLGSTERAHPDRGEVVFVDRARRQRASLVLAAERPGHNRPGHPRGADRDRGAA